MNKKNEIIEAAITLLEEEGDISSLNLRKTAKRAGCAHTNVYNYFPSLESLKWAMLEKALKMLEEEMFGSRMETDRIISLLSRYMEFALKRPAIYKLIWTTALVPEAAPSNVILLNRIPEKIISVMKANHPEWTEKECDEKADILHSYIHGKILNLIFQRIPSNRLFEEKSAAIAVCSRLLSS